MDYPLWGTTNRDTIRGMTTAEQFGLNLTGRRSAAGAPSYRSLEREMIDAMGTGYAPTNETIRLYHSGKVSPEKADITLVTWLAERYGCTIADISETVAERAKITRDLLIRMSRCSSRPDPVVPAAA